MVSGHRTQLALGVFVAIALGWLCIVNVRAEKWTGKVMQYEPANPVVAMRPLRVMGTAIPAATAHAALTAGEIETFNAVNPSLAHLWIVDLPDGFDVNNSVAYVKLQQPKSNLGNHMIIISIPDADANVRVFLDEDTHLALAGVGTHVVVYDSVTRTWTS